MRLLRTLSLCAPTLAIAATVSAETFKADVPDSLITPDVVETTRLGTLRFTDGMPDADTVQAVYDNLDFNRGVELF